MHPWCHSGIIAAIVQHWFLACLALIVGMMGMRANETADGHLIQRAELGPLRTWGR